MGKLEVIFRIRLAYPLLRMSASETSAVIQFEKNAVRLEPPQYGPPHDPPALDGFAHLILHVERECTDEQGRDTSDSNADRLRINQDAAKGFWQLFDAIREAALVRDGYGKPQA